VGLVAALLFVLGGIMTGLFVAKGNELDSTRQDLTAQVADRDSTISTKEKDINKLKDDLQKARDELDSTKQDLTGTQNDRDKIEKEKQVISKCLTLFSDSMAAALAGDRAKVNRLSSDLDKTCTEAEKYL
jgi:chromosome segregation ATPase